MTELTDAPEMDLAEQLASTRRRMAEIDQRQEEMARFVADLKPGRILIGSMLFGAALFGALVTFTKLFL